MTFFLLPLLVGLSLRADAATGSHQPMRFEHITLDDGLSQSTVLDVLQDSRGLLWIATENGLNRFNGSEMVSFHHERGNPKSLSNDFIFDIEEDRSGRLWIATNGGGLVKFDRSTSRFTAFRHDPSDSNSIVSNIVRRLMIDDNGTIWIGTRGAGLDRLDPESGQFRNYRFGNGDRGRDDIYALFQDSAGFLWVGGDHGLTRLDVETNEAVTFTHDPDDDASLTPHGVRAIAEDADGSLWVGSEGGGLSRLVADAGTFRHLAHSANDSSTISSNRVASLFRDNAGRLWAGTTHGLNLVDHVSGRVVRYAHDAADASSLGGNDITTIYEDRGGLLYVGTKTRGLDKWDPRAGSEAFDVAAAITGSSQRQPNVTSFVEDEDGTLWVGTFGDGLNAVDRKNGGVVRYRNDPTSLYRIEDDRVMSLMRDREGRIWVGTMTSGINRIDPEAGEYRVFKHDPEDPNSLSANGIMALFEDSAGRVWVGTFGGGISRFEPRTEKFTRFDSNAAESSSTSSDRITGFAEDAFGQIWIGTEGGGLNLFDPKTGRFYQFRHDPEDPETLAADTVYSLTVDATGALWVGTHGGGLGRVIGDLQKPSTLRFQNISQKDGLANDVVYGVQFDDAGWMWMSTNNGISRFDPESGDINNLYAKDGLQSQEFNFGAHYRSPRGELFFGGPNGFNAFDSVKDRADAAAPSIALAGFLKTNYPVRSGMPDDGSGLEPGWQDNSAEFEFSAPAMTLAATGFAALWNTRWAYAAYAALAMLLAALPMLGRRGKLRREKAYSQRLEDEVDRRTEKLLEKNKQLRQLNDAIRGRSLKDTLTGLGNRRFVEEIVPRDLALIRRRVDDERYRTRPDDETGLAFMLIDMDNFRSINETYGRSAGDQVLRECGDLLLDICRCSDFVTRWKGDQFLVIARQPRGGEAEGLAERIRVVVADHDFVLSDGRTANATCSIGFAAYPLFRDCSDESGLQQIIALVASLVQEAKRERNAWAGMLGPGNSTTSPNLQLDPIAATSLLFLARRAETLFEKGSATDSESANRRIKEVG